MPLLSLWDGVSQLLNDLNGVLLNYSVTYSGIEIDTVTRVIYLNNPTFIDQSITLINLEEYTTYSIIVAPFTMVGKGPDAEITQRTNQAGEFALLLYSIGCIADRVE